MSSLSSFWDLKIDKELKEELDSGRISTEEFNKRIESSDTMQQDFQEGIDSQIPNNQSDFIKHIGANGCLVNDIRFRLASYGFCNLLCFFRVDYLEVKNQDVMLDSANLLYFAQKKGINFNPMLLKDRYFADHLLKTIFPQVNFSTFARGFNICQLPSKSMDSFGDTVIIIKNEKEFIKRIINAIKRQCGYCVIGDVMYHHIQDRVNPEYVDAKNIMTVAMHNTINSSAVITNKKNVISYGCLDKYDRFQHQKEWRVCWLPNEHNNSAKILKVGNLEDIIEIVSRNEIREVLLNKEEKCLPAIIQETRNKINGNVSYAKFKKIVNSISQDGYVIMDIG